MDALGALAMSGAQAVGAGVAAADDEDALAFCVDRDSRVDNGRLRSGDFAGAETPSRMNAFEFAAGNLEVARLLGSSASRMAS